MSVQTKSCAALLLLFPMLNGVAFAQKRPVTIADSVEASTFGAPLDEALGVPLVAYSPKHDEFVVVTRRGVMASNTNRYTLTLFKIGSGIEEMHPAHLFDMDSSSIYPAIEKIQWTADGTKLIFIGEKPHQLRQIYSFDVPSRQLVQLTHCQTNILTFAVTADLQKLAFLADPAPSRAADSKYEVIVSDQSLTSLLGGKEEALGALQNYQMFIQKRGSAERRVDLGPEYPEIDCGVTISPDGRYATVALLAENRPASWAAYHLRGRWIARYDLVDTTSAHVERLLDAPSDNWRPELAWNNTSQSVVVAGTYLPLGETGLKTSLPETQEVTAEIQIKDRHVSLVAEKPCHLIEWNNQTRKIVLQEDDGKLISFAKNGDKWRPAGEWTDPREADAKFDFRVEQDMNTPPRLIAFDKRSGKKSGLFDPNPQFANLSFGSVQEIEWKSTDGHTARGGLYLPVGYVTGTRYPLVIQTHGWSKKQFWIDGPSTAGYAAQALAGRGFVVAQVDEPTGPWTWQTTPQEGPLLMSMIEGLIDDLDKEGLIDRNRVGLFGWSRSGYLVRYTLAFSHDSFGAAVIAEGFDDGYFHYLSRLNLGKTESATYEQMIGAAPFGQGIQDWLQRSSAFHLEDVHTPVRILGFSWSSLLGNWEWFAGLKHLNKPVEFVLLPDASHDPVLPEDRVVAQGGDVDWFDFWLKGEEDSDPKKSQEYARWREMKQLHHANVGTTP
jgi:dipeptidyl aminopeptidase/acylaminoacyl peptidase